MSLNAFAEKIILYIAPYVFNIYMNVLMYDFGINGENSVIQEKEFFNENKSNLQMQVNLLFRKSHYDIYYKLNFYEDYKENLNILINKKEDINNLEKELNDDNNIEKNQKDINELIKDKNNCNNNFMNDKNVYNNMDINQKNIIKVFMCSYVSSYKIYNYKCDKYCYYDYGKYHYCSFSFLLFFLLKLFKLSSCLFNFSYVAFTYI